MNASRVIPSQRPHGEEGRRRDFDLRELDQGQKDIDRGGVKRRLEKTGKAVWEIALRQRRRCPVRKIAHNMPMHDGRDRASSRVEMCRGKQRKR